MGVFRRIVSVLAGIALISVVFSVPVMAQQSSQSSIVELGETEGGTPVLSPCGNRTISIARMQWPSSIVLAYIHAQILEAELGCRVNVVVGDMAATASSMVSTGEPAIAPELWITRISQIWNSALESGRIGPEGTTYGGGALEGWFLPPQLSAALPELKRVEDLKQSLVGLRNAQNEAAAARGEQTGQAAQADQPATQGGEEAFERIRFISCPVDWACSIINKNLIRAYGLEDVLELVEPANRFEMDSLIAQSVSRDEMIVFYYWQPNGVLAQFDFVALDMGAFDEEHFQCLGQRNCENPQPSSFAHEKAFIVAVDWISRDVPEVALYLRRATMPVAEMNRVLNWQAEGALTFEELATRFVAEREEIWKPWVEGLGGEGLGG